MSPETTTNAAGGAGGRRLASLSIFFPCHNEEGNVERVVRAALEAASRVTNDFEVIVSMTAAATVPARSRTGWLLRTLACAWSTTRRTAATAAP